MRLIVSILNSQGILSHEMNKLFFSIIFSLSLFGFDSSYWAIKQQYELKKDEPLRLSFTKGEQSEKFVYLWTLFMEKELVNKIWYKRGWYTFSLSSRYKRDIYRLELFDKEIGEREDAYMLVRFVNYDTAKHTATLEFLVHNELEDITMVKE